MRDLDVTLANTHVVAHAGKILALVETSLPTRPPTDLGHGRRRTTSTARWRRP